MPTALKNNMNVLNMSKAKRDKMLRKLEYQYDSAAVQLREQLRILFPQGTKVKVVYPECMKHIGYERKAIVKGNSLYPDQIMINGNEHISWSYLEKVSG